MFLSGLAYVDRASLKVRCTATICEASGMAIEDAGSGTMAPVWERFDRDAAGDMLARQGLERAAAIFGTGRVREEFVLHYRRANSASSPENRSGR